jgi:hypothetical protein
MARRKRRSLLSRVPLPDAVEQSLDSALDRALALERPVVRAYVDRLRDRYPTATPAELIRVIERHYLRTVVGTGAASGGAAALPGVGTAASVATSAAEIAAFVTATAAYVLAVAEIHELPTADPQLRRALVLTVLVGDVAEGALASATGAQTQHWAKVLATSSRKDAIKNLNGHLATMAVRRFGARQGALVAGRALPFGVGAGVGAIGNAAVARGIIGSARKAFGPPPARFHGRVVDVSAVGG